MLMEEGKLYEVRPDMFGAQGLELGGLRAEVHRGRRMEMSSQGKQQPNRGRTGWTVPTAHRD